MHELIGREITDTVKTRLKNYPAVALLGARQVGKSTIAGMIIEQIPKAIHLDLEIYENPELCTDQAEAFRDRILSSGGIGGDIYIYGNKDC